jgi:hypothetical protein
VYRPLECSGLCTDRYSLVDSKPSCLAGSRTAIPQVLISSVVLLERGVAVGVLGLIEEMRKVNCLT